MLVKFKVAYNLVNCFKKCSKMLVLKGCTFLGFTTNFTQCPSESRKLHWVAVRGMLGGRVILHEARSAVI
jgi:hypothetical protein